MIPRRWDLHSCRSRARYPLDVTAANRVSGPGAAHRGRAGCEERPRSRIRRPGMNVSDSVNGRFMIWIKTGFNLCWIPTKGLHPALIKTQRSMIMEGFGLKVIARTDQGTPTGPPLVPLAVTGSSGPEAFSIEPTSNCARPPVAPDQPANTDGGVFPL